MTHLTFTQDLRDWNFLFCQNPQPTKQTPCFVWRNTSNKTAYDWRKLDPVGETYYTSDSDWMKNILNHYVASTSPEAIRGRP